MISLEHKCVFVHIPKAAGTSIGTKLGIYKDEDRAHQDHRTLKQVAPLPASVLAQIYKKEHAYALYRQIRDRLEGRKFLSQAQFESFYKFTFVRNPWGRVHSWYKNILKDPVHMKTFNMPENSSLSWFIHNRLSTVEPQLEFIRGWDGKIAVDFVGRFENLNADFSTVCKHLGIKDATLPEKMRIGTPSYIPAYQEEDIELVAKAFAEEIAYFGFKFGE